MPSPARTSRKRKGSKAKNHRHERHEPAEADDQASTIAQQDEQAVLADTITVHHDEGQRASQGALTGAVSQTRGFFKVTRPPLKDSDLEACVAPDEPEFSSAWTPSDEDAMLAMWNDSEDKKAAERITDMSSYQASLWKACLRMSRPRSRKGSVPLFSGLVVHPFFEGESCKIVMALQYAVICRLDDRRRWRFKSDKCPTLLRLEAAMDKQEGPLMPESLHTMHQNARTAAFKSGWAQGVMSEFLLHVGNLSESMDFKNIPTGETVFHGVDVYPVTLKDLEIVTKAVDTMSNLGIPLFMPVDFTYSVFKIAKAGAHDIPRRKQLPELYRRSAQHEFRRFIKARDRLISGSADGDDEVAIESEVDGELTATDNNRPQQVSLPGLETEPFAPSNAGSSIELPASTGHVPVTAPGTLATTVSSLAPGVASSTTVSTSATRTQQPDGTCELAATLASSQRPGSSNQWLPTPRANDLTRQLSGMNGPPSNLDARLQAMDQKMETMRLEMQSLSQQLNRERAEKKKMQDDFSLSLEKNNSESKDALEQFEARFAPLLTESNLSMSQIIEASGSAVAARSTQGGAAMAMARTNMETHSEETPDSRYRPQMRALGKKPQGWVPPTQAKYKVRGFTHPAGSRRWRNPDLAHQTQYAGERLNHAAREGYGDPAGE
ncbi:hypothetical protein NM208_g7052 [Fusarium decemcellulare]|uniref:Uncharacterized protein n=1 Tax=Fusarium decemcellulare TaxID=57161 RepID=A0ACC1SAM8_9HYPO|nr:hypothetical protein NM208_g7052 [Fusarium decemcellulare]